MDVRLTPEQEALRGSAAHVVHRLGPRAVGQIDDRARRKNLDHAAAASGWRELRTATDDGMPTASGVEAAIVAEELGRGLADAAFLGPTLAAELRRLSGAQPATSAETVALEPDLSELATAGVTPAVAIDAQGASRALLLDPETGSLAWIAMPPGQAGGVDLTRPCVAISTTVEFASLDGGSLGAAELAQWTALGLSLTCADLVGAMSGAVQLACAYAAQRRQYGAHIGSFQAVQHLLADAYVALEGARSATLHAAWAVDALPPEDAVAAAAVAKAYCSRAAREVCETCIQVHGGIGNTWDCMAHVYLRRALLSIDVLGNGSASLTRVLQHHGIGGNRGLR
jgi:alkylation response protein AidB-like acyl-CoA dehydrogenase